MNGRSMSPRAIKVRVPVFARSESRLTEAQAQKTSAAGTRNNAWRSAKYPEARPRERAYSEEADQRTAMPTPERRKTAARKPLSPRLPALVLSASNPNIIPALLYLQCGEGKDSEYPTQYPETCHHLCLFPALEFEMVMNGRHPEKPLSLRDFEVPNLEYI